MSAALVPIENTAALDSLEPEAREVAITGMLDQARVWLAHAVESTAPAQDIAHFKAFVATAAETAKRLRVSKEIQQDAEVMVRRSERALGQAIRRGQEAGEIASRGRNKLQSAVSPSEFLTNAEAWGDARDGRGNGIYAMTDNVTDAEFEEALDRAEEEGNVSRANVVRKIEATKTGAERTTERWEQVAQLAREGHTSRQIGDIVGILTATIRRVARERGIDIPADRARGKVRPLDSNRVLSGVTDSLSAAAFSIQQIDPLDLDQESALEQIDSLTESLNALRKATRKIKESLHG